MALPRAGGQADRPTAGQRYADLSNAELRLTPAASNRK
jgi:hypothetical protein